MSWIERNTGWPPSSANAVSNANLVLVDLFSKISAKVLPTNLWCLIPALLSAFTCFAMSRRYLISSGVLSISDKSERPFIFTAIFIPPHDHIEILNNFVFHKKNIPVFSRKFK